MRKPLAPVWSGNSIKIHHSIIFDRCYDFIGRPFFWGHGCSEYVIQFGLTSSFSGTFLAKLLP